jgi:hypothetical protein
MNYSSSEIYRTTKLGAPLKVAIATPSETCLPFQLVLT